MRNHRILVVEDEPDILIILEWALKKGAYDVVTAQGARQALRLLAREHFDLILTDLAMPGTNGIEMVEQIRAMPGKDRIPIVVYRGAERMDLEVGPGRMGVGLAER